MFTPEKERDEGEQKMPPKNVPLCHMNYFDMKAIKIHLTKKPKQTKQNKQQNNLYPSLNCLKEFR